MASDAVGAVVVVVVDSTSRICIPFTFVVAGILSAAGSGFIGICDVVATFSSALAALATDGPSPLAFSASS